MIITTLLCVGFLAVGLHWMWKIGRTKRWLAQKHASDRPIACTLLIPCLEETARLEATVTYFLEHFPSAKIVLVTTAREPKGKITTLTIARALARRHRRVKHLHYSGTGTKMAHQLNYAVRTLNKPPKHVFGVYNADSRPDPRTLRYVAGLVRTGARVCQQYGDYSRGLHPAKSIRGLILASAAAWQNRWSVGFEIPHALDQFTRWKSMNYCIGHGLFFTREVYDIVGGFRENMHNEDAIFGLALNVLNIPIHPLPCFDQAETAGTVRGLFLQQSNWYFGPLEAPRYYRIVAAKHGHRAKAFLRSMQLLSHALYWIMGPTLLVAAFVFSGKTTISLAILTTILYLPLLNEMAWRTMAKRSSVFWSGLIGAPLFYLIHGLAAYHALGRLVWRALTGRSLKKQRTPGGDALVTR